MRVSQKCCIYEWGAFQITKIKINTTDIHDIILRKLYTGLYKKVKTWHKYRRFLHVWLQNTAVNFTPVSGCHAVAFPADTSTHQTVTFPSSVIRRNITRTGQRRPGACAVKTRQNGTNGTAKDLSHTRSNAAFTSDVLFSHHRLLTLQKIYFSIHKV